MEVNLGLMKVREFMSWENICKVSHSYSGHEYHLVPVKQTVGQLDHDARYSKKHKLWEWCGHFKYYCGY